VLSRCTELFWALLKFRLLERNSVTVVLKILLCYYADFNRALFPSKPQSEEVQFSILIGLLTGIELYSVVFGPPKAPPRSTLRGDARMGFAMGLFSAFTRNSLCCWKTSDQACTLLLLVHNNLTSAEGQVPPD
jgi:hypothetical protein